MRRKHRVLITGAAGSIGVAVTDRLAERWDVVATDVPGSGLQELDVTDAAACRSAFADVDAVVHLAAVPDPGAGWDELLPANVIGAHSVASAAMAAGVRRLVLASSLQAVSACPADFQVRAEDPPRPANLYGATKAWSEAIGSWVAASSPVEVVAMRIGYFAEMPPAGPDVTPRDLSAWLSADDCAELVRASVEGRVEGFTVVNGVSAPTATARPATAPPSVRWGSSPWTTPGYPTPAPEGSRDDGQPQRALPAGDYDYETLGVGYATRRRADPRIARLIHEALADARTVVNVGAGAGSYEPDDRPVLAVEPSARMRAQRPAGRLPAVDATAEHLPFDDDAFDAAMATVTVHQWSDVIAGLREMRRVSAGPVVILTFDGAELDRLWLGEYVPELFAAESQRYPSMDFLRDVLGGHVSISEVPVPIDCTDGFTEAYYARPEAFLDPGVRAGQSAWGFVDGAAIDRGVARLAADLESGVWDERYGHLRTRPTFTGSLRLVVAPGR